MKCERVKQYLAVLFVQFGNAGMVILAKSALNKGMNHYTFAVYRTIFATAVIAPFALLLERKGRPKMTVSIFFKILLLAMLEPVIDQNLYYTAMKYTTATFAVAMGNILPAITFLMAWILRLEKVNVKEVRSQAKILGTLVTVGGAMIMTFVGGTIIRFPWTKQTTPQIHHQSTTTTTAQDNIKGSLMIIVGSFCWAGFYILQAITLKSYPAELSLTALICAAGSVLGAILTLVVERNNTAIWALHWDSKLLAALYGGVICSGVGYYLSGYLMKDCGPVFVTAFIPLSMVIVAVLGSFILAEQTELGRVLGAIVIVLGLYMVLWGRSKDQKVSAAGKDGAEPLDQQMTIKNYGANTAKQDDDSVSIKIPSREAT